MRKLINVHVLPRPGVFVDDLIQRLDLRNDAQLAKMLRLGPPTICKLRKGSLPLTAEIILRIHDAGEVPIREIRQMARISEPTYPEWDSVVNKRKHTVE